MNNCNLNEYVQNMEKRITYLEKYIVVLEQQIQILEDGYKQQDKVLSDVVDKIYQ